MGLAFASRNLPGRPTQRFVCFNGIDDGRQLSLFGRTLEAPHQIVGSLHERCMHCISGPGEMLNCAKGS